MYQCCSVYSHQFRSVSASNLSNLGNHEISNIKAPVVRKYGIDLEIYIHCLYIVSKSYTSLNICLQIAIKNSVTASDYKFQWFVVAKVPLIC